MYKVKAGGATMYYWNELVYDFVSLGSVLPQGMELRTEQPVIANAPKGFVEVKNHIPQYQTISVYVRKDEIEEAVAA